MSFYYWIPNERPSIKLARLNELGLGYAVEDRFTARGCDSGPDGNKGIVICHGDNKDGKLGYFADEQVWRQLPVSQVWVGHYKGVLPTPSELERKQAIPGLPIKDDLGNVWCAPIARKRTEEDGELFWTYNVPRRLTLDEFGQWVPGDVKPRYQRLWQDALACERAVIDKEEIQCDLDDVAIRALQTNYRVSAIELDVMGIYDESLRSSIISALIDLATMLEWVQKKTAGAGTDGDSSASGEMA